MSTVWNRYGELNLGGRVLRTPPMAIDYEETFSLHAKPTAKIRLYNPARETVETAKGKRVKVTFAAGYKAYTGGNAYGTRFEGEIYKYEYQSGETSELLIEVSDKSELWTNSIINRSFRGPVAASEVITDILKGVGITPRLELGEDHNYERGVAFAGQLSNCLRSIAADTKSKLVFRGGSIGFLAEQKGIELGYYLSERTGLLSRKEIAGGYKCTTLFLHDLTAGSIAKLRAADGSHAIKIINGTAKFSAFGDAGIEFEAVRL